MSFLCMQCGDKNDDTAKFCKNCGNQISNNCYDEEHNVCSQEKILESEKFAFERKKYGHIGGWLILLGIGVVISPFRILFEMVPTYKEYFSNNIFRELFQINSTLSIFVALEIFLNTLSMIGYFFAIYTFFAKKKIFIKLFIGLLLYSLFMMIVEPVIVSLFLDIPQKFENNDIREIGRGLIYTLIWVPYLLFSDRAKLTFIK